MSAPVRAVSRTVPDVRLAVLALGGALALALLVDRGDAPIALAVVTFALMTTLAFHSWRVVLVALLAYLPFSGIPSLLAYPNNGFEVLLKDLLFVGPVYLGFAADRVLQGKPITFPGAPTKLLALFALLVVLQALNPGIPNPLVGLIGVKVWLLYVPMLFVGYHLIREPSDIDRVFGVMCVAAILPAALGIVESTLIVGGHGSQVFQYYGAAAGASTQHFSETGYHGGGFLPKISSTFTFITQYYLFTSAMVAVAYAWWQARPAGAVRGGARFLVWLLMLVAAFLTGARGAFIFIPALVVMIVVLERGRLAWRLPRLAPAIGAFIVATAVIGAHASAVFSHAIGAGEEEFHSIFIEGSGYAVSHSLLGAGTGMTTTGSRYAVATHQLVQLASGGNESWYVKAAIELGIAGALIVAAIFGVLLVRLARAHLGLHDRRLRTVSAALLALLAWNILNATKGPYIDLDPMDVYFWLLLGIAFKLRELDTGTQPSPGAQMEAPT